MGAHVNVPAFGPKSPGATPLHLAAAGGHLKVMDELLEGECTLQNEETKYNPIA